VLRSNVIENYDYSIKLAKGKHILNFHNNLNCKHWLLKFISNYSCLYCFFTSATTINSQVWHVLFALSANLVYIYAWRWSLYFITLSNNSPIFVYTQDLREDGNHQRFVCFVNYHFILDGRETESVFMHYWNGWVYTRYFTLKVGVFTFVCVKTILHFSGPRNSLTWTYSWLLCMVM